MMTRLLVGMLLGWAMGIAPAFALHGGELLAAQAAQGRPGQSLDRMGTPGQGSALSRGEGREALGASPPPLQLAEGPVRPGRALLTRLAVLRLLNLTPEQQRLVREVRRRYAAQLLQLRQEAEERRDALREAIYGDVLDPKRVEQCVQDFLEKQGALMRLETQLEIEFRKILTPEQLATFREIQNEELSIRRMQRELRRRQERLRERLRGPR